MKASEQLAKWISDENDLYGTSQDEILKLVFQYPAVASYKLILAKWQFLRHGAVEEGLWQQLLLQWPNPGQLFEWRSKSFDFNKVNEPETYQSPEMEAFISEKIPTNDQPVEIEWNWGQYLDEMQAPVSFVWEIPVEIDIVEIEELPVFDYLLQTDLAPESIPAMEEFKITEELPIVKEADNIKARTWDWAKFIEENLDHISSVWISENVFKIKQIVEDSPVETDEIQHETEVAIKETIVNLEKKNLFSRQSATIDSPEEYQASAFVKWLQSQKQLEAHEKNQQLKLKHIPESEVKEAEKEVKKSKQEKEKIKEKNKEKDKHKKKDKKKKKLKKKDKLEEEIFSSLEFSDDVASETYAALLAKQGHYELSERIYERLRLIYPEKSSYFAGLIKKLKS
ncbi:MAG: hypothetical protein IPI60_14785 [Saprospiraceae bacterium]|nr:hypothetical protein [Saprospiraceae bacterium]